MRPLGPLVPMLTLVALVAFLVSQALPSAPTKAATIYSTQPRTDGLTEQCIHNSLWLRAETGPPVQVLMYYKQHLPPQPILCEDK